MCVNNLKGFFRYPPLDTMDNKKNPKKPQNFECKKCDFNCCNKKDYHRHLSTRKHLVDENDNEKTPKNPKKPQTYSCNKCDKIYNYKSGLAKHNKVCIIENIIVSQNVCTRADETQILSNLVKELIQSNIELAKQNQETQQQNQELQKHVIELCKNGTHNTITNSNNKAFNINLFLNEQCKDAINFHEFVENIKVSREDLMNTSQLGFVGGVSKILLEQLKQLGVHERPIHCTDLKRDTVYIKENNEWNKEEDDVKIRSAIQEVSRKSMGTLIDWKKNNPDYEDMDSRFSQDCLSIQRNSIAGYERETLFPKVIKELNRSITIDKETHV